MVQWVKDLALSPLWLWLQLQSIFEPWPRNFHMLQEQPKKKKEKKKKRKEKINILWSNVQHSNEFFR